MISRMRLIGAVGVVLAVVCVGVGCRETDPTPSHYTDLGDGDEPLLATGSPWHDLSGEGGNATAEWVPFREPNFDEEPEEVAEGEGSHAEVEAELRELIDEYNEWQPRATSRVCSSISSRSSTTR